MKVFMGITTCPPNLLCSCAFERSVDFVIKSLLHILVGKLSHETRNSYFFFFFMYYNYNNNFVYNVSRHICPMIWINNKFRKGYKSFFYLFFRNFSMSISISYLPFCAYIYLLKIFNIIFDNIKILILCPMNNNVVLS
jgi:hypothetical protein